MLFIGVALSITAFPVLARILSDRGLQRTPLGTLALTCAAINDAIAWCLLAFVVSIMQATPAAALRTGGTHRALHRGDADRRPHRSRPPPWRASIARRGSASRASPLVLVAVLLSAVATEFIGIHAIFGAFLLGAIIPHDSKVATQVTERIADIVRVMFLPAFFAFTGLRTEIGLIASARGLAALRAHRVVATAGKFGGTGDRREGCPASAGATARALGILMNTRGLVELIVLNIGLDLGVITPRLFTMLVIMALVTTMMTAPVLPRSKSSRVGRTRRFIEETNDESSEEPKWQLRSCRSTITGERRPEGATT